MPHHEIPEGRRCECGGWAEKHMVGAQWANEPREQLYKCFRCGARWAYTPMTQRWRPGD